ncbi:aminotransferase class I/II-fold pyridoxal phosphate-dependent enzyme [Sphingobacterium sp. SG20118]|uniref:aminotransferase class I/II-fold pyridoxal phosphate-dependent enzyme n=1 Tax=Sphingobacterium sp. SG20118 TaxID=3367156 RepID=UPI0037DFC7D6
MAELIKEGDLKRHLKKAKKCYHQRRDYLDLLLQKQLGDYLTYDLPSGGMAIWLILRPEFSIEKLQLNRSLKIARIAVEQNAFRFGFASLTEDELNRAVSELNKAFKKME